MQHWIRKNKLVCTEQTLAYRSADSFCRACWYCYLQRNTWSPVGSRPAGTGPVGPVQRMYWSQRKVGVTHCTQRPADPAVTAATPVSQIYQYRYAEKLIACSKKKSPLTSV